MITIPRREYDQLRSDLSLALSLIVELQTEIKLLKNGRKSDTSSTPSSQDYSRSNKNNLREKTNRMNVFDALTNLANQQINPAE